MQRELAIEARQQAEQARINRETPLPPAVYAKNLIFIRAHHLAWDIKVVFIFYTG